MRKNFVEKPDNSKSFGRSRRRWKDDIKLDPEETRWWVVGSFRLDLTLVKSVNGPSGFHQVWRFHDFFYGATATSGWGPPNYRGYMIILARTPQDARTCDNTQYTQQTDIHASFGFRTRNPSKRATTGISTFFVWPAIEISACQEWPCSILLLLLLLSLLRVYIPCRLHLDFFFSSPRMSWIATVTLLVLWRSHVIRSD